MLRGVSHIAQLINKLLDIWERWRRKRKAAKREDKINKAKKDPAEAFRDHFGSVGDVDADGVPDDSPSDAPPGQTGAGD